ncbi:YigZ family protein [Vibrio quintilis]|uniref:YigZ family protein n=1 Tax=Vibrio quintilis TaxID=1117707 RepID=UPI000937ECA6|nr:YigZ family protein [Vibrio quintilis]
MHIQPYLIPSDSVQYEEEIKKSRFLTYLHHTPGTDLAKQYICQIRALHPGARHHCWAFVAGVPENSMLWGFSDDGEPSGTAGKPILSQLSGSGIGEITAVVVRYSGGIKLGTGGLVKAYGGGVQQALKQIQVVEKKVTTAVKVTLDYELLSVVRPVIENFQAKEVDAQYLHNVILLIEIEVLHLEEFKQAIINKSRARVVVELLNNLQEI